MDEYITREKSVLEVGCGTGYYGLYYADKCEEYVGVDLFPPHTELFNNKLTKIKNLGTNFQFAMKIVDDMSNERFELMKPIYDKMASYESCTGMSGHALLICGKSLSK